MIHNNATSSGQGSKQVRWFLQTICLYTDANLKWPCRICLRVSFERPQDLDRHIQLHLPCWVYCPYARCKWRGCRLDQLQGHLAQQGCNRNSPEKECRIYNVKTILDMIRNAKSNDAIQNARNYAVSFVEERATVLGRNDWLVDPWGHRAAGAT